MAVMEKHGASAFEQALSRALEKVRVTLSTEKSYAPASQVHHQYQDKYHLVEKMTNTAAASQLNCLSELGLTAEALAQLQRWAAAGSAVSLRLKAEERCTFDREESREVEAPTKHVEEHSVGGIVRSAWTSKVVTTVTDYFWRYEASYEILAVRGVGAEPADRISILSRTGQETLKTAAKSPPHAECSPFEAEVNVSWLFRHLDVGSSAPAFRVDREHKGCHTPRRNADVEVAWEHCQKFAGWADTVANWLRKLLDIQPDPTKKLDVSVVDKTGAILIPVLPVLQDEGKRAAAVEDDAAAAAAPAGSAHAGMLACLPSGGADAAGTHLMTASVLNELLAEEHRALLQHRADLGDVFPMGSMVASHAEAWLILVLRHCVEVCRQWMGAMAYVEGLLRKQLIAAIGKEVSPADFAEYMRFHCRKLFKEAYWPKPLCFAVRRSELHSPEGTVSIEEEVVGPGGDSNITAPIVTISAAERASSAPPQRLMSFPLSASSTVCFGGDRFLHAWLSHQFSEESGGKLSLVARTRQFSSMIVLLGRITSATTFQPKYAAILQNKDELTIPLDLSTIPTPKEFKDAIESLSPEQQDFAKAFRAMQLESTLFGVLVIQIKPQLEKVLNLPEDALTKEIKLTQDLMQLFIKYQIPSDLLSFNSGTGNGGMELLEPTASDRLTAVKEHVEAMNRMIEEEKQEEIRQRQLEAEYARREEERCRAEEEEMRCVEREAMPTRRTGGMGGMMGIRKKSAATGLRAKRSEAVECVTTMPTIGMPSVGLSVGESLPPQQPMQQQQAQQQQSAAPAAPAGQQAPQRPEEGPPQEAKAPSPPPAEEAAADLPEGRDYTAVPREMDQRFEQLDSDGSLRPTIISPGEEWSKRAQKALLASPTTTALGSEEQKTEKTAAFDLLDALTKSGALPIEHASLHVIVAATHCFDKTITETVVQDNTNPIEKVERSALIMATTVHQRPAASLVQESQLPRLSGTAPQLFLADAE